MQPQSISSDLIRGHIDTIILYSLIDSDKFAQQISDSIEEKSNNQYKMNQATLYSSLKRLESLKFVSSYWFDSEEVNGRRKFFKITDLGKQTVKNNLENWSYSRELIDKLVDCTPQPIYKTQVVEKIVEVPVSNSNFPLTSSEPEKHSVKDDISQNFQNLMDKPTETTPQSTQEINFRNILNGLIKASQPKKQDNTTELEPVIKESDNQEKLKFNETISAVDFSSQKSQSNGKIDFGDLVIKAAQEGYKVRISSKDSSASKGKLLINKLNLFCSLAIYLLFMVEFIFVASFTKSMINFSALAIVLVIAFASVFPIVYLTIYLKNPAKRKNKKIYADIILTVSIVVFNLILLTLAGNLIFGDLQIIYLILPIIVYLNVLLYYVIKYYLAKNKKFNIE